LQSVVDHILDIRGMIVPVTFLNITQALREIKPGESVEIIGSDPETKRDLFKILRTFPYELLNINENDEKTVYRVSLRKGSPAF
jgi:TusA-related sulfurtransferase